MVFRYDLRLAISESNGSSKQTQKVSKNKRKTWQTEYFSVILPRFLAHTFGCTALCDGELSK